MCNILLQLVQTGWGLNTTTMSANTSDVQASETSQTTTTPTKQ